MTQRVGPRAKQNQSQRVDLGPHQQAFPTTGAERIAPAEVQNCDGPVTSLRLPFLNRSAYCGGAVPVSSLCVVYKGADNFLAHRSSDQEEPCPSASSAIGSETGFPACP